MLSKGDPLFDTVDSGGCNAKAFLVVSAAVSATSFINVPTSDIGTKLPNVGAGGRGTLWGADGWIKFVEFLSCPY